MAPKTWAIFLFVLSLLIQSYSQDDLRPQHCNSLENFVTPVNGFLPPTTGKSVSETSLPAAADVAAEINEFGFNFFLQVLVGSPNGNVVFSPLSIAAAFSLLYIGAGGDTKAEIGNTLNYVSDCYPFFLQDILQQYDEPDIAEQLSLATRLYADESLVLEDSFVNAVGQENVNKTNFDSPDTAREEINSWVLEQTRGLIKDLIGEGQVNENLLMALVNALYFKGAWAEQFDPDESGPRTFNGTQGAVDTEFMSRMAKTRVSELSRVVEIEYEGGRFSMVIVKSSPGDAFGPAKNITDILNEGRSFLNSMEGFVDQEIDLRLPKFTLEETYSLTDIMKDLGMELVFSDKADLSGIAANQALKVDQAIHKARIQVNEEGTEAAAATGLAIVPLFATTEFIVDQPFVFYIRDNQNGLFLFMGSVSNFEAA